jgi:hypothetical protein
MKKRISPTEFHFQEHLTPIQVQTTVAKEDLDDPLQLLQHVKHNMLKAGTIILVQVMNETKEKLLHEAEFRVITAVETLHSIDDDYSSRTKPQTSYQTQRWTEWKSSKFAPVTDELLMEAAISDGVLRSAAPPVVDTGPEFVRGKGTAEWNFGKKTYDIKDGDGMVVASERNKKLAQAIADGLEPLPVTEAA